VELVTGGAKQSFPTNDLAIHKDSSKKKKIITLHKLDEKSKKKPNAGVEPATLRLRVSRSTD
jgi:hypothetical protein